MDVRTQAGAGWGACLRLDVSRAERGPKSRPKMSAPSDRCAGLQGATGRVSGPARGSGHSGRLLVHLCSECVAWGAAQSRATDASASAAPRLHEHGR